MTSSPYKFPSPCPNYIMLLYGSVSESHALSCSAAGDIASGATVSFDMQLPIPTETAPGLHYIDWFSEGIGGAKDAGTSGKTPYQIDVLAPTP
ncbi:MAG: hypothetical protein ABI559_07710 [Chloroflexota bacterium]